jgi:PqqD family protein of HPr-rel-A system
MDLKVKPVLRVNDQGTLFDPETGDTFLLNPSGLEIFKRLQQGQDPETAYQELSQEYELNRSDFDRFLLDFGSLLKSFQLVDND